MKKIIPLFLAVMILLAACMENSGVTSAPPEVEAVPDMILSPQGVDENTLEHKPIDLTDLNGTWNGVLSEPLGFPIILDCLTDKTPQNILISFITDENRYLSFLVDHKIEEGTLKLRWGDEPYRNVIELSLNDEGILEGDFTDYDGETAFVTFTKSVDSMINASYQVVKQSDLVDLLAENADFNRDDAVPVDFEYITDDSKLNELREKYNLNEIAGIGNTQFKALNLLNWLGEHTNHNGNYSHSSLNAFDLLEYAYDTRNGINCANLSILFSEVCLSVGIQARALWLMPENPNDMDNHVITMAFIPEDDKWILLDPSFNCYLSDTNGSILSPLDIRQKLAAGEQMKINSQSKVRYKDYTDYLAKDMFYFSSARTTKYGAFDERRETIYLCPADFDLDKRNIANSFYRSSLGTKKLTNDEVNRRNVYLPANKSIFATPESFWGNAEDNVQ